MEHAAYHQGGGVNVPPPDQRKCRKVGQQYNYHTNRAVSVEADNPVNCSVGGLDATWNGNREHIHPRSIRYECCFVVNYFILIIYIISCP